MDAETFFVEEVMRLEETPGEYLYVRMTKKNQNTLDVVRMLAQRLRIPRSYIAFAGTKDRRATTIQYLSIYKGLPERVRAVQIPGVTLEPLYAGEKPLVLGGLEGNRFRVRWEREPVKTQTFLVNYFGQQRFSTNNVAIGKSLLKKQWGEACRLIAREDVDAYLAAHKKDYIGALQQLDRRLLSLYVNAVQSFVWNAVAAAWVRGSYDEIAVKDGLVFVKHVKGKKELPLIAFDTTFDDEQIAMLYRKVLAQEGLSLQDFVVRAFPVIMPVTIMRPLFVDVRNFAYADGWLSFFLPTGSYATVLLKQLESFL